VLSDNGEVNMESWIEYIGTLDLLGEDSGEKLRRAERTVCALRQGAEEARLSGWLNECPVRRVRSRVLGVDVLLAADDATIPTHNKLVVYRHSELTKVIGMAPALLRATHLAKWHLDSERNLPILSSKEV
jgi:hypothetical protein